VRKTESRLRELLRMMIQEDARSLVGDYLWPNNLLSNRGKPGVPTEVDTPREADLRDRVFRFMKDNKNKTLNQADVDDLITIASDPRYKGVLSLYRRGKAYRGVSVSAGWFERNFGMSYDEIADRVTPGADGDDVMQVIDRTFNLKPTATTNSWSKSFDEAVTFSTGMGFTGGDFSVPIVYEADASENTFIDLKGVYDLYDTYENLKDRRREKEVLLIGPARVNRVHVIGWRGRKPGKSRTTISRERGTGYDDVGTPSPWDPGNYIDVNRKYIDREFDAMNIPDVEG
jgi:hypothetical protein